MTTPSPAAGSEELRERLAEHWIKHNLNLGQYKSELHCACGDKLIVDGHANDWHSSHTLVMNQHLVDKVFTAQNNATYEAVMEAIGEDDWHGDRHGVYRRETVDVIRNQLRAELRQSMAKIFGKENKEP